MIQWYINGIGDLVEANRANKNLLEALRDGTESSLMQQVTSHGVLRLQAEAQTRSPYLTGTLAFSHVGEITAVDNGVDGRVYIDPSATNPVFGGRPAEYGVQVHERKPWLDRTIEQEGDQILQEMAEMGANLAIEVWRS